MIKYIHNNNIVKFIYLQLVDDALNLARAGQLGYDIALSVVLSMEHETEYAVWKAFVRNMNFLKKRLEAFVFDDDDLDPDIYLVRNIELLLNNFLLKVHPISNRC